MFCSLHFTEQIAHTTTNLKITNTCNWKWVALAEEVVTYSVHYVLYEENKFIRKHLFTVGAICGPMMGHQFHKCNRATCFADSAYDHFPTSLHTLLVPYITLHKCAEFALDNRTRLAQ